MKRYEIVAVTNDSSPSDPYPTLLITEDEDGEFVRYEDAQGEIDRLRAALTEALPALRMAYKGGHELTEYDHLAYKTACELTDPPNPTDQRPA